MSAPYLPDAPVLVGLARAILKQPVHGRTADRALAKARMRLPVSESPVKLPMSPPAPGRTLPVIHGRRLRGEFGTITVDSGDGKRYQAVPVYTATGLSVRLANG